MFALAARLFPQTLLIVGLVLGAIPAGAAGWVARGWAFELVDKPALEKVWTAEVESAAAKAKADEQLRQFEIGEHATEQFIQQSALASDDRQAELDMLQREIERYELDLKEGDRVCSLDLTDFQFLGLRETPGSPRGSR